MLFIKNKSLSLNELHARLIRIQIYYIFPYDNSVFYSISILHNLQMLRSKNKVKTIRKANAIESFC